MKNKIILACVAGVNREGAGRTKTWEENEGGEWTHFPPIFSLLLPPTIYACYTGVMAKILMFL